MFLQLCLSLQQAYLSLGVTISDITMVVDQLVKNLLDKLKDIAEYLEALKDSIPPCKPLPYVYHAIGTCAPVFA